MASSRLREFEILKGLLIICVVIGHAVKTPFINVFWFHVPAFFLIAGYFAKIPTNNPLTNKEQWQKWVCRFVVPYLLWSVVLYCLFRPEGILKNLIRTLYGGLNNVTLYSYPFWFINALFVSTVLFACILYVLEKHKISVGGGILVITTLLWIVVHIKAIFPFPYPLPWGIDQALGALVFMGLGYMLKGRSLKKWHIVFPLLAIAYIVGYQIWPSINCTLNMMPMTYNSIVIDMVVPMVFSISLYIFSKMLTYVPLIREALSSIGACTFTIFFTHAAILAVCPWGLTWGSVLVAVAAGWLIHNVFIRNRNTKMLFVGK